MHKFDLVRPCKDCPFIKGGLMNRTLNEGRLKDIVHGLTVEDASFTCHKTIKDYYPNVKHEQHCAGALIYLEKLGNYGRPNQEMRIAERLGFYDRTKLDMNSVEIIAEGDL